METDAQIEWAVLTTLKLENQPIDRIEVGVQLTTDEQILQYNLHYRGKKSATNVLSFALMDGEDDPLPIDGPLPLGDLILAYETIFKEAQDQNKPFLAHVTHLAVHGTLHLLGYDHERSEQAACEQESREIAILAHLELPNPYA
ncbi:MAG: rRNA maturation RNase YbeY [Magnetococcales bacterium]|nr:rRNA maturation RNase YbeY [Magnetococcales bacterium]